MLRVSGEVLWSSPSFFATKVFQRVADDGEVHEDCTSFLWGHGMVDGPEAPMCMCFCHLLSGSFATFQVHKDVLAKCLELLGRAVSRFWWRLLAVGWSLGITFNMWKIETASQTYATQTTMYTDACWFDTFLLVVQLCPGTTWKNCISRTIIGYLITLITRMISYRKVRAATGQWRVWPGIRHIKQDWVSAILSNVTRQLLLNDTEVELCHIQAYCNVQAMILQLISPFSIFILK